MTATLTIDPDVFLHAEPVVSPLRAIHLSRLIRVKLDYATAALLEGDRGWAGDRGVRAVSAESSWAWGLR